MNIASIALVVIAVQASRAEPPASAQLVKTELISNVAEVGPGKPFQVGVVFTIEPGWHIYWTNPGDSGMATSIELNLPAGFQVGELQFPTPVKFTQPGDIVGYGYTDRVAIVATVNPPVDDRNDTVNVTADVKFLVCERVCIPGEAKLSESFPVRSGAAERAFPEWQKTIPAAPSSAGATVSQSFDWERRALTIVVDWRDAAPRNPDWFPAETPDVGVSDVQVTNRSDRQTVVTATVTPLARKPIEKKIYESVLAYDAANGARQGIRVKFAPGPSDGLDVKQD